MPSHTSHLFQPLDLAFFAPEKSFLGTNLDKLRAGCAAFKLNQWTFLSIVIQSTKDVLAKPECLAGGFRKANIYPHIPAEQYIEKHRHIFNLSDPFNKASGFAPLKQRLTTATLEQKAASLTDFMKLRHCEDPRHCLSSTGSPTNYLSSVGLLMTNRTGQYVASKVNRFLDSQFPCHRHLRDKLKNKANQVKTNFLGESQSKALVLNSEQRLSNLLLAKELRRKKGVAQEAARERKLATKQAQLMLKAKTVVYSVAMLHDFNLRVIDKECIGTKPPSMKHLKSLVKFLRPKLGGLNVHSKVKEKLIKLCVDVYRDRRPAVSKVLDNALLDLNFKAVDVLASEDVIAAIDSAESLGDADADSSSDDARSSSSEDDIADESECEGSSSEEDKSDESDDEMMVVEDEDRLDAGTIGDAENCKARFIATMKTTLGSIWSGIQPSLLQKGNYCWARFYDRKEKARNKQWYRCTVAKVNDNGSCNLKYDDGDKESNVLPVNIVFMNRGMVKYALAS